jgi:ferrous iron transport protein A
MDMSLLNVDKGAWTTVLRVEGDVRLVAMLQQQGIFPGDQIRVIRSAPLGGPLLVEVGARKVALSRSVAAQVIVGQEPCASL